MGLPLETRVKSEIGGFLRDPSYLPELKARYVSYVLDGMRRYLGIIAVQREKFRAKGLLKFCTDMAMQNAGHPESTALAQGAQYADEILFDILNRRFDNWAASETLNLHDGTWQEIVGAYEKLKDLITITFMEYHPSLVTPGERLNLDAVRPKKPQDAMLN